MSKASHHDHPAHLSVAGQSFQYYRSLPVDFPRCADTPKQIRWSLGRNFEIAKLCTRRLNQRLDELIAAVRRETWPARRALKALEEIREQHQQLYQDLHLPLGDLPTPRRLASSNLAEGYQRLTDELQRENVIYQGNDGGYHLKIVPTPPLLRWCMLDFHRLDWPLDTTELEVACWRSAYIFQAVVLLERWEGTGILLPQHDFRVFVLALHDYLAYVRKDHGFGLQSIPASLPQSIADLLHCQPISDRPDPRHMNCVYLMQDEQGFIVIDIDFSSLGFAGRTRQLNLKTTSVIVASLIFSFVMHELGEVLDGLIRLDSGNPDVVEQAMREIADLFRRYLDLEEGDSPLRSQVDQAEERGQGVDPQIAAALTAMSSLLPQVQQNALQQLLNTPPPVYPGNELPSRALRFGELVKQFIGQQDKEQVWTHPRTRQLNHSRLDVLLEIVGADRVVTTLTRAEIIRLRDTIRLYPRNRNKQAGCHNRPLHEVITQGNYTPINPRTGKQYFELLQRVLRYALDHELITTDVSAGLAFNTKGAPRPKRRTYTHTQIEKLLNGPVYTLTELPAWRLRDYKFWLPLLGLFQGARLNELCQLRIEDVRCEQGIWLISINDRGEKQLKTGASDRDVPLHQAVLDAGFLEFVEQRRMAPGSTVTTPLFAGLPSYGIGYSSHSASKWFLGNGTSGSSYLSLCNLGEDGLTFHGLRHTFITQARNQHLDILVVKALVGHADDSVTGGYGEGYPLPVLYEVLQKINYQIAIDHIHYRRYHTLQLRQERWVRS